MPDLYSFQYSNNLFAEYIDVASAAYDKNGRQYDFKSSTVIISEFAAFA